MSAPPDFSYISSYALSPPPDANLGSLSYICRASQTSYPEEYNKWANQILNPPAPLAGQTSDDLQKKIHLWRSTFENRQRDCTMGSTTLSLNRHLVIGTMSAGTAVIPPVGIIPKLLTQGAIWGLDKLFEYTVEKFDEYCGDKVLGTLGKHMQDHGIEKSQAVEWSRQIQTGEISFEDLEEKLLGGEKEEALLGQFSPESKEAAKAYVKAKIKEHGKDLGAIHESHVRTDEGNRETAAGTKKIDEVLKSVHTYQKTTDQALGELVSRSEAVDRELKHLALRQDRTADDVRMLVEIQYNNMSTSQKRALLAKKDRDGNPIYLPNMKNRERTELALKIQDDIVDKAAVVFNGANQLLGAIGNFVNIDPKLAKVVEVGGALIGAATSFLSGNVLGTLGAIGSLFGKKGPDPAAERHKQVMAAFNHVFEHLNVIQQKLDQINAKLDVLAKNQAIILQTIQDLSKEIFRGFELILKELYETKQEIYYNRSMILEVVARDARRAHKLLAESFDSKRHGFENGEFTTFDGLITAMQELGTYYQTAMNGLRDIALGNDISNLFQMASYATPSNIPGDVARHKSYETELFIPAFSLLADLDGSQNFTPLRLTGLMRPALHYKDVAELEREAAKYLPSENNSILADSIKFASSSRLTTVLIPSVIADYGRDVAQFHGIIPLIENEVSMSPHSPESLAKLRKPRTDGLELVKGMLKRVDLAIAQLSIIAGYGSLQRIHEMYTTKDPKTYQNLVTLWNKHQQREGDKPSKLEELMRVNPWFRHNFALCMFYAEKPTPSDFLIFELNYPYGIEVMQIIFQSTTDEYIWKIEQGPDENGKKTYIANVTRNFAGVMVTFPSFQLPFPGQLTEDITYTEYVCHTADCGSNDCQNLEHTRTEHTREMKFANLSYPDDMSNLLNAKELLAGAYASYTSAEVMKRLKLTQFAADLAIKSARDQLARNTKP